MKGEKSLQCHVSLAKLYEQTGQKAKAIEKYEKFITLWKDADPGIAEVEDARKRRVGLMSNNPQGFLISFSPQS